MLKREHPFYRRAHKRFSRLPSETVLEWAESAVWEVQRGLGGYRAETALAALEEAERGIFGLLAANDVLLDRERAGGAQ